MPILRFENVTKSFDSDSFGVKEVSFAVEPGEFVFITGPSGSGKTTLMRLLLKEYPFNSGEIFFHDTTLSDLKDRHVHLHRRKIGVVFQDYKLIPEMNVWENIALPLWVSGKAQDEVERRVTDLLNLIKLPEKALHFPSQLSGGEAQRVGIARALAIGPEVVIADEPTGNLDPATAQNVARLLKKINELGTTVLIATHDHNILATYPETRKLTLEKGQLVKDSHGQSKLTVKITDTPSESAKSEADAEATTAESKTSKKSPNSSEHHVHGTHEPEQHIAQDLIPAEPQTAQSAALPWWKKIFGAKKPAQATSPDQADTDTVITNKHPHRAETDDDLVTVTEEALDDAGDIAEPHHETAAASHKTGKTHHELAKGSKKEVDTTDQGKSESKSTAVKKSGSKKK